MSPYFFHNFAVILPNCDPSSSTPGGGPVTVNESSPSREQFQFWGAQIREARELAGKTVDDIANSLNLRVSFVEALENGSADAIMGVSYVRQHLRALANKVGVTLEEERTS